MNFHPNWINNTCLIIEQTVDKKEGFLSFKDYNVLGSGFFLSYKGKNFLITAKHVIKNKENINYCYNRYNQKEQKYDQYCTSIDFIHEKYNEKWYFHPNTDVELAVSVIDLKDIILFNEKTIIPFSSLDLATDVYILGYPLTIRTTEDLSPIVRKGLIARKIEKNTLIPELEDFKLLEKSFLIDSYLDANSSGSPIIQRSVPIVEYNQIESKEEGQQSAIYYERKFTNKYTREGLAGIAIEQLYCLRDEEKEYFDEKSYTKIDILKFLQEYGLGICLSADYLLEIFNSSEMRKIFTE